MTTINGLEFTAVVMCDEVRREITNKDILIGAYAGYVVVTEFPAQISAAFWMEVRPSKIGEFTIQFRIFLDGKEPVTATILGQVHELDAFGFFLSGMQILVEKESELHLEALDGEEWKLLKRKKLKRAKSFNLSLPPFRRRLLSDFRPPLGRHTLRPRLATHAPQRHGSRVLALLGRGRLVYLARGNPADHDGGTDHVGGALLAFGASGHHVSSSRKARNSAYV
jgi:hypothetical protein